MLYTETVYPKTLELLKKLQSLNSFKHFALAGGTGLSLYFGHRISIDLDFFIHTDFNVDEVVLELNKQFDKKELHIINQSKNSLLLSINDVKVDILAHQYPLINKPNKMEGISLYSKKDILAMKLNALANRGTKKDFFDIYESLQHYSLTEILEFFKLKYVNNDTLYIIRSLIYFEDAELDLDPVMIKNYDWETVKAFLVKTINTYLD